MRKTVLFNDNWKFTKEGKTENVNLPHTWNAIDGQGTTDYYRGECVYEKAFKKSEVPGEAGDKVYVEFRGVNSSAKVEVNGTEVIRHDGGYSTFRGEISSLLKFVCLQTTPPTTECIRKEQILPFMVESIVMSMSSV